MPRVFAAQIRSSTQSPYAPWMWFESYAIRLDNSFVYVVGEYASARNWIA